MARQTSTANERMLKEATKVRSEQARILPRLGMLGNPAFRIQAAVSGKRGKGFCRSLQTLPRKRT